MEETNEALRMIRELQETWGSEKWRAEHQAAKKLELERERIESQIKKAKWRVQDEKEKLNGRD